MSRWSTLASLVLPIYLPAALSAMGRTLLAPFLPVWLRSLGADDAAIGAFFSAQGLGATLAGPLAGELVASAGPYRSMLAVWPVSYR